MNYLQSILFLVFLSMMGCKTSSQQTPISNDLWMLNAPQGIKTMQQKMWIHKENKGALILKSTSDFTFTKEGNYKTHTQTFPDGKSVSQTYEYNDMGMISSITEKKDGQEYAKTTYEYKGKNPLEIHTTVVGANNYFPKIIKYFDGKVLVKEERFDAGNKLIDLYEYSPTQIVHTNYGLSDKMRFKYVSTLKDGYEVKSVRYNAAGEKGSGRESELDKFGNATAIWSLDNTGKRKKETSGYVYLYQKNGWTIRASKVAEDYGSGKTRTLYTRSFSGKTNASIDEKEVLGFLKKL